MFITFQNVKVENGAIAGRRAAYHLVLYERVAVDGAPVFPVVVPQVGLIAELLGEVAPQLVAVAAAEAAVGLAIFVLLYRKTGSINIDKFNLLKW